jgi:hypothetical protein
MELELELPTIEDSRSNTLEEVDMDFCKLALWLELIIELL